MFAMRLFSPLPVEYSPLKPVEAPMPEPGPGQMRVRVRACGVCHTDLHLVEGDLQPPSLPIIPGHQVVGVVESLGVGVDQFIIGQRVGIPWLYRACQFCASCRSGNENLCQSACFTGFHVDGGFAEMMLADARYALALPDVLADEQAAPLLCAGIIGYRSLKKADLQPGERLGLFGFGASAHLSIQLARFWGCEVYVFTRSQQHRAHASSLGAGWVGGVEETPPKFLDRAVIFAPAGWIVPRALEKIRPGGTLAINAIHMSDIPAMPYPLLYGERTLRSVANATYRDGVEFLQLAQAIPLKATVQIFPLTEANQALQAVKESRLNGEAVLRIAGG